MKVYWAVPTDQYNSVGHQLWKLMVGEHFRILDQECYEECEIMGSPTLEEIALNFLLGIKEAETANVST